jgi:dolichyl-phosphate beta-glucosyltransferase
VRQRLRRFAAIGALVTLVDLGLVLVLRLGAGVPVIVADAIAITAAATLSYLLNRWVTFADDPHVRWVREPGTFVRVALISGVVDVAVLRVAVSVVGSRTFAALVFAKGVALVLSASIRAVEYRRVLFARVRREQVAVHPRGEAPGSVRFSVVIPAYHARDEIGPTVLRARAALDEAGVEHEIVVVDDGSEDGTAEAAMDAGAQQVVVQPSNRGKGAAVRAGVLACRGRTVAFTDADLAYPPEQLVTLLHEVEAGWDMVVGSRRHTHTTTLVQARRLRELTGRLFNLLTLVVLLGQYRDTQCGLKAFRSDVARSLFSKARVDGFAFDVELFHLAERYRLSLKEVPVEVANTEASTVRVGSHAVQMVRDLVRIRGWASSGAYSGGFLTDPAH